MLEQRQIIFGSMVTVAVENLTNLWEYDFRCGILYIELVQNLGRVNIYLEHWAQLFQENLGTCRLA